MARPRIDLTGSKFGALRVFVSLGKGWWWCDCDCGGIRFLQHDEVRRKRTCGQDHRAPSRTPIGTRSGRLVVVEGSGSWVTCECECGNLLEMRSSTLKHRASCGCSRDGTSLRKGTAYDAASRRVFARKQYDAKARGLSFTLTQEE